MKTKTYTENDLRSGNCSVVDYINESLAPGAGSSAVEPVVSDLPEITESPDRSSKAITIWLVALLLLVPAAISVWKILELRQIAAQTRQLRIDARQERLKQAELADVYRRSSAFLNSDIGFRTKYFKFAKLPADKIPQIVQTIGEVTDQYGKQRILALAVPDKAEIIVTASNADLEFLEQFFQSLDK